MANGMKKEPFLYIDIDIALWGPTASGMHWLLRAFPRELEFINSPEYHHRDFYFALGQREPGEREPHPCNSEPPINIPPTVEDLDSLYEFERIPIKLDAVHLISARKHKVLIHQLKMSHLLMDLEDPDSPSSALETLAAAPNHIITLGITAEEIPHPVEDMIAPENILQGERSKAQGLDPSDLPSGCKWSRDTYYRNIAMSLNHIGNSQRRNIAVCLTMVDQLGYRGTPWEMLRLRYGAGLKDLLEQRKQFHNIEVFATSSAGFILQDGERVPNMASGTLSDPDRWRPVNPSAPFFWIFQQNELARLRQEPLLFRHSILKKYIPYPEPVYP
jgi:hypothetical protein